ncbi:hypothetical protein CO173_02270 [Candidatus Uhrbacteria bacterium CG_4_9_14_3_um_filter_41_35]|uniref:Uncharacterized protein n=1 Tax=Candidatus Uhrbacteria bacterium CG_4_9_14_3_um_filter_41_35 TaxID=1975034 RepID=A0A2M7XFB8_9BACT|nr:MAG: hypothetical protein COV92_01125 [Candidatus Uhrbacteria bacterium CG11_big_fil_rev_8_21_14_0_20_41_9]PJA46570.1 MAG: hypothetical protein CO173_02270 [Candidatus Uhrbacteria bacterium CG_4_9_14_3_um_filter_41_35]
MFSKQFFGKLTWQILLLIVGMHLIAIVVRGSGFELPVLIGISLITLFVSKESLSTGLLLAFTEIFVGGHGHLIEASILGFSVSIRIVIFSAVMLAWLYLLLTKKLTIKFDSFRDTPWLILLVAIVLGTGVGFLKNDFSKAFDDMNGYLTIFYLLPVISINWNQLKKRELLQVFTGSTVWLVIFTLLLSYLFTHLDGKILSHIYTFVRDSRLAEVTLQTVANNNGEVTNHLGAQLLGGSGYWYRIFMQSQIFVVIALSVLFSSMMIMWRNQKLPDLVSILVIGTVSTTLLSMSRSFILGLGSALFIIWCLAFFEGKRPIFNIGKRLFKAIGLGLLGFGLALFTVIFPFPAQPNIQDAVFYSTSSDTNREVAVSSRWSLLTPMMTDIWQAPIVGNGFGHEVTYTSDDPRVRSAYEGGVVTTYRFEWGYQDLWLKMGILGLIAFAWYFAVMMVGVRFTMNNHGHSWLVLGLGGGLVILFISNIFSPYLNHPIGFAYMIFVVPFIDFKGMEKKRLMSKKTQIAQVRNVVKMSPVLGSKIEG